MKHNRQRPRLLSKPRSKLTKQLETSDELLNQMKENRNAKLNSLKWRTKNQSQIPFISEPFNEWNTFYSQCSSLQIFKHLHLALDILPNVDYEIHDREYKICGRQCINHLMCDFQIELFRTRNSHLSFPDHILIEV